jgi:undecaprenyl-diphosphatase
MGILNLWGKVLVACLPAAIIGILFDDFLEEHLHTPLIISLALIVYGVAFIWIENRNKSRELPIKETSQISYKQALIIGAFQVLSLIPGTSRSGATILGALIIGVSRPAGAEFTFFLAIPVMFGASAIKLLKFFLDAGTMSGAEIGYLAIGMAVAFVVSLVAIKFLMNFVKKHDFKVFGWYRIALGALVIATLVVPPLFA